MITGVTYLIATIFAALLIAWGNQKGEGPRENSNLFRYRKAVRLMLLICIPIWIAAAAAVKYTVRPGVDSEATVDVFVALFLVASLGSAAFYAYAKRFFVVVGDDLVQWRKFTGTGSIEFAALDSIEFKRLNKGEQISLNAQGRSVLLLTSAIDGFVDLRNLIELRAKRFGIAMSHT